MSGVAGGTRIQKADVQTTFNKYVEDILSNIDGFKKATLSGSVKIGSKSDYGDLDIITHFEGDDKKQVKHRIISSVRSKPDNEIAPFKSEKYKGRKYYNSGEIVTVLYPIQGKQDQYVQVDNIIALSEQEHRFKNNFLDIPAEKQGLILGLAKVILLEEQPSEVFSRLGIKNIPKLQQDEELEFNLSSSKLTLRKVKLKDFKTQSKNDIWSSTDWNSIQRLFINYNIDGSFEQLLKQITTQLKNPRSKKRIKGIFNSMVSIKSGEVGTPKGEGKQKALDAVNSLLEANQQTKTVALYAGGFKPPHKAHFINAQLLGSKADKLVIFIGPKIREGVKITAEQSRDIWQVYSMYLNTPVEIVISEVTPIKDLYEWVDQNKQQYQKIITGAMTSEMGKFKYFSTNKEKYPNVEIATLPEVKLKKQDDKFSATTIRTSKKYTESGKWIPRQIIPADKTKIVDIALQNTPTEKEIQMQEAVDETLNQMFTDKQHQKPYKLNTSKYNYKKTETQKLTETVYEITLSKHNAVSTEGDLTGGKFTVGSKRYRYAIKNIKNPYKDQGTFYNIQFTPEEQNVSTPTQDTSTKDYIKILSTMYKIIVDFTDKQKPEYIGISSLESGGSKNYHLIYNALSDPKNNKIPGYFRKDVNLQFNSSQGKGRFVVLKRKQQEMKNEGSSGTPSSHHSVTRSENRQQLVDAYKMLNNSLDTDNFDINFNQDHIIVKVRQEGEKLNFDYTPYMSSILEHMIDKGMKITPLPEIKVKKDLEESANFFGKTAYYNPNENTIVLYTHNRHPKDVMRSFTHEMIHHKQNLEGKLKEVNTSNTNSDDSLLELEKEAYLQGNIVFRNWEDGVKNS